MRKVEKLPSGRYKVRFRLGKRETSETFDTHRAATDFARLGEAIGWQDALDRLFAGEQADVVPTLDQVAADHIAHLTAIEPGTRLRYTREWARTWSPRIGHLPADQVTTDAIKLAVNDLAERYAEKSLKNYRGLLSAVCTRAIEQGHLRTNPAKGVRLPRGSAAGDEDDDMVCLTPAEWSLIEQHTTEHYRPLVRFLVGTGCRWGEAVVLRKRDVDLAAAKVRFTRGLKDSPDGNRRIGVTKTRRSKRTVVISPELVADLEQILAGRGPDEFVFTAPRGGQVWHRTFWSDHWRPALWRAQRCATHTDEACRCGTAHPKRCGVHERISDPCGCAGTLGARPRIHDLRHTHASWLLAHGVPIHVVSRRLGHESIQVTVDTYSHLLPDAQLAAAEAASIAFRAIEGG